MIKILHVLYRRKLSVIIQCTFYLQVLFNVLAGTHFFKRALIYILLYLLLDRGLTSMRTRYISLVMVLKNP